MPCDAKQGGGIGRGRSGDRLVHVLDFPEPEAGDQLAGFGERPVDDRSGVLVADIAPLEAYNPGRRGTLGQKQPVAA